MVERLLGISGINLADQIHQPIKPKQLALSVTGLEEAISQQKYLISQLEVERDLGIFNGRLHTKRQARAADLVNLITAPEIGEGMTSGGKDER